MYLKNRNLCQPAQDILSYASKTDHITAALLLAGRPRPHNLLLGLLRKEYFHAQSALSRRAWSCHGKCCSLSTRYKKVDYPPARLYRPIRYNLDLLVF